MKIIKKNQMLVYFIVLVLMIAGYLNYTNNTEEQVSLETSMQMEANDDTQLADIGDATLVSSNDMVENNSEDSNNTDEVNAEVNTIDYFIQSKLERDKMYSQMIETYEKILNSENSLETQNQSATEEIQKINEIKNSIMICENLIGIKGFKNNVIFVNGESINVVIEADELKQEEIAQIQNIISREMKAEINNIHITNKSIKLM